MAIEQLNAECHTFVRDTYHTEFPGFDQILSPRKCKNFRGSEEACKWGKYCCT